MINRVTRPGPLQRASGFTLLEAIVTLTIVALISALLMQALARTLDLRERLLRQQAASRVSLLQEQWFRDSLSAAVADLPDALGLMRGSRDELELVTVAPLGPGGPGRVRWWLGSGSGAPGLRYADGALGELIVIKEGLSEAAFSYLDQAGQWHSAWPPSRGPEQVIPRMVRLEATTTGGRLVWLVPLIAAPRPPEFLRPKAAFDGI